MRVHLAQDVRHRGGQGGALVDVRESDLEEARHEPPHEKAKAEGTQRPEHPALRAGGRVQCGDTVVLVPQLIPVPRHESGHPSDGETNRAGGRAQGGQGGNR